MRSERKHHRDRLAKKRRFSWGQDLINQPRQIGIAINTPKPCSCWMCGNPRKNFGEATLQERSAKQLMRLWA